MLDNRVVTIEEGDIVGNSTLDLVNATHNSTVTNETYSLRGPNPSIVRQRDAPQDLDLVSWPPKKRWVKNMPGYDYEVGAGVDTYIYVIDGGVNLQNPVSNERQHPSIGSKLCVYAYKHLSRISQRCPSSPLNGITPPVYLKPKPMLHGLGMDHVWLQSLWAGRMACRRIRDWL